MSNFQEAKDGNVMIPHKRKILMLAVILAAGTVAVQVINAQSGGKAQHGSMQMGDMMKQCKTHCRQTTDSIDKTTKSMDEAKQSNDPAKMRAAIDDAEKNLGQMKSHMNMCINMMDMMQNMQGGKMGGMMSDHGTSDPSTKQK